MLHRENACRATRTAVADVRDPVAVTTSFEEARVFGGIDIVVINAGINTARTSVEATVSKFAVSIFRLAFD
jgi:NAD(P)-dependent dehydrogenase (short-subunit alcohol dehydrogenase family)